MIIDNIFLYLGEKVHSVFPNMEGELRSARMDEDPEQYLAKSLRRGLRISVIVTAGVGVILSNFNLGTLILATAVPTVFLLLFSMGFLTFVKLPQIRTKKRVRRLEKELPYALRDVLIQIDSGIPLYEAMTSATSGYGEMSEELKRITKDVDGGESMIKALELSIVRNPSERYRRAMWQLTNSIKSGTDISSTLSSIVDSIISEQKLEIENYGEELNPYILVYLLLAVIGPALAITGLIVISSFTGTSVGIRLYAGILFFLVVIQVFFLNLIKSKRPKVRS